MKQETIECRLAQDLMPLAQAGRIGEDSRNFLKEHCAQCEECRSLMEMEEIELPKRGSAVKQSKKRGMKAGRFVKLVLIYIAGLLAGSYILLCIWEAIWEYLF